MLVQLLPDQVAKYWEQVKFAVQSSFPPTTVAEDVNLNKVLESLLSGSLVAWVSVDKESRKIVAIVTTTIMEDACSSTRNLLIYSLFGVSNIGKENWTDGYETLMKYAKSKGCRHLVGFTRVELIKKLAKFYGGDVENTLISIDVNNFGK
jgi:hypothetical protein